MAGMRWILLSVVVFVCQYKTRCTWAWIASMPRAVSRQRNIRGGSVVTNSPGTRHQATSSQVTDAAPSKLPATAKRKQTSKKKTSAKLKNAPSKKSSKIKGKSVQKSDAVTKQITKSDKEKKSKKVAAEATAPTATKGKKRRVKKAQKIVHWRNTTDPIHIVPLHNSDPLPSSNTIERIHWVVRGNPLPLRRHRTSRGFVYNPSAPAQESFRNITLTILEEFISQQSSLMKESISSPTTATATATATTSTNGSAGMLPLFPGGQPLAMVILFRMKRPNLHFIGSKRCLSRLRDTAPVALSPTRSDVDNLAKFVLDSLNGILYEDDRQIHSLQVTKLLDTEGPCDGSTEIVCRPLSESDLSSLLNFDK